MGLKALALSVMESDRGEKRQDAAIDRKLDIGAQSERDKEKERG